MTLDKIVEKVREALQLHPELTTLNGHLTVSRCDLETSSPKYKYLDIIKEPFAFTWDTGFDYKAKLKSDLSSMDLSKPFLVLCNRDDVLVNPINSNNPFIALCNKGKSEGSGSSDIVKSNRSIVVSIYIPSI